jgi:hypothetical protein
MSWQNVVAHLGADVVAGLRGSLEELAIAELVTMPFTVTLVLLLGWMTWAPWPVLFMLWAILQVAATLWNAGWRTRTAADA